MTSSQRFRRTGRRRSPRRRTPCGQISRSLVREIGGETPSAVIRFVRQSLSECSDQAYGSPLGHLLLQGKITASEFESGRRWDRLSRRYRAAIGAPRSDPTTTPFRAEIPARAPAPTDVDSEVGRARAEIDAETIAAFHAAHAIVLGCGAEAERDMRRLCEGLGELPAGYEALNRAKDALRRLAVFWGLERRTG